MAIPLAQTDSEDNPVGPDYLRKLASRDQVEPEPVRIFIDKPAGAGAWVRTRRTPQNGDVVYARWKTEKGRDRAGWAYFRRCIVKDETVPIIELTALRNVDITVLRWEEDIEIVGVREEG